MSKQEDFDRAQHAKQALSNPALQEAFLRYESKIIDRLRDTDDRDINLIVALKQHLTALRIVRKNLETMVADGEFARLDLDNDRTLASRVKSMLRKIA